LYNQRAILKISGVKIRISQHCHNIATRGYPSNVLINSAFDENSGGDNTTTAHSTPVDVQGLASGVIAIAAGGEHTCVLTTHGGVKCWGNNQYGELGDGTTQNHSTPVDVYDLTSGVVAIAAGWGHNCALTIAGGVKCWGWNNWGQLGNGATADFYTIPVDVQGLASGVSAISAIDGDHTCALTIAGGVKCWGQNEYGQLGDGTDSNIRSIPVDVQGLSGGVSAIAASWEHTCALTLAGGVMCWGRNKYGQLGDDTNTSHSTPADVPGLTVGVSAITPGGFHTCALIEGGGVKCWGYNGEGELGDGTTTDRSAPVDVQDLSSRVIDIVGGGQHTCALTTSGGVKCWGYNLLGELGDGTNTNQSTPVDVLGLDTREKIYFPVIGSD
jgi:alpha-tubulin suppressor-like RCC1 family protein